jgi:hypothetical protein
LGITKWWFGTFTIFVSHLTRRVIITSFISLRGRITEVVHYTPQRPCYHSHCPKQTRLHPEDQAHAQPLKIATSGVCTFVLVNPPPASSFSPHPFRAPFPPSASSIVSVVVSPPRTDVPSPPSPFRSPAYPSPTNLPHETDKASAPSLHRLP